MPRRRRPLDRKTATRDAKLIIIATEDSKATVRYFEGFASPKYYQNSKAQLKIIPRNDTRSAPEYILTLLDSYRQEYDLNLGDELWLLIDVDRWGDGKLSLIARECQNKGIKLAVSNPAIELWFLLHLKSIAGLESDKKEKLLKNEKVNENRTALEQEIMNVVGAYNKSKLNVDDFLPHVQLAIQNSKELEVNSQDRWPQTLGTRVYILAESIINTAQHTP